MTFQIEVGGRARAVSVNRVGPDRYRIVIDGQPHVVDAVRGSDFSLSLLVGDAGRTSRELQVAPGTVPGELLVGIDGRTVAVTVNGRRMRRAGESGAQADGEQAVVAPMPGRVARVLVAPGDEVAARQGVVVVEAMKMENELRSPKAGRVKAVAIEAGASVEAGRVLVIIE